MPLPARASYSVVWSWLRWVLIGLAGASAATSVALSAQTARPRDVVITIDTAHPVRRFVPRDAFGAGIDGRPAEDARATFDPRNVAAMRSAGLPRLSYRLRTELGIQAWHWTDRGRWSDAAHRRGYWIANERGESGRPVWRARPAPRPVADLGDVVLPGYSVTVVRVRP